MTKHYEKYNKRDLTNEIASLIANVKSTTHGVTYQIGSGMAFQIANEIQEKFIHELQKENEYIRQNNISATAVKIVLENKDDEIKRLSDALYYMADYYLKKVDCRICDQRKHGTDFDCQSNNRRECVLCAVDICIKAAAFAEVKINTFASPLDKRTIAVDFDGTLCVDKFPEIGAPKYDVINHIKDERARGSVIILWTCRKGLHLAEAISWCERQGLTFDYINQNTAENIAKYGEDTRKINADVISTIRRRTLTRLSTVAVMEVNNEKRYIYTNWRNGVKKSNGRVFAVRSPLC